ncbi:hypothetical protein PIB30_080199, partial [Stylosanthes scabra]|nr:hypothetical protein [Stylosanthes scabra]
MEVKQFLMKSMVAFIVFLIAVSELSSAGYEMMLPSSVATHGGDGRVRMENFEGRFFGLSDRRSLRSNPSRPPAP